MPTVVENRRCKLCGTKYRTKVKKGKDTMKCPTCKGEGIEKQLPKG